MTKKYTNSRVLLSTHQWRVFSRKNVVVQLKFVLDSKPTLGADSVEVICNPEAYKNDAHVSDDGDFLCSYCNYEGCHKVYSAPNLPVLSLCVLYELKNRLIPIKLSHPPKHYYYYPKNVSEALGSKEWGRAMMVEIDTREKNKIT